MPRRSPESGDPVRSFQMGQGMLTLSRREATCLFAVALFAPGTALGGGGAKLKLRLLATSDLHCYLESYDYYHDAPEDNVGLVRIATLVKTARREVPNALLFDNGDLIQGNPLGDLAAHEDASGAHGLHPVIRAMNALGYDGAVPGNHDFNFGLDFLEATIKGAKFPYVLANVDRAGGGSLLPPYAILERDAIDEGGKTHRLKIGIIGLVTPQIMLWDKARLEGLVTSADIIERARRIAPEVRAKGADLVIALCHSGFDTRPAHGMDENVAYHLTEVAGIDAVITGHQHRVFPDPAYATMPDADVVTGAIHHLPTVMPGFYGSHLGVVDLDLVAVDGGWRVVAAKAEARPISRREGGKTVPVVASDPDLVAVVAEDHRRTLAYVRQPIGHTTRPINSFFAVVEPDAGTTIVNAIQRRATETALQGGQYAGLPILSAAAPFRAGGSPGPDNYTDIPAGEIAIKNVADLYLYANTLHAVRVTGAELREWLEMSATLFRRIDPSVTAPQMLVQPGVPTFNFDTVSGVTYRIDLTESPRYDRGGHLVAPDSHRIRDLAFAGKPVADDAAFIVATNNYRANGGGNFPGLDGHGIVLASPDILQNVIADYIRSEKEITPSIEANWRFVPIAARVDVEFESAPKAKALLADHRRVSWVGPGNNGFDLYRLDLREG